MTVVEDSTQSRHRHQFLVDIFGLETKVPFTLGILVGTLTTGSVADTIGRQKALFYGQLISTILFFLQIAATDVIGLTVVRFFLGPFYLLIYGQVIYRLYNIAHIIWLPCDSFRHKIRLIL